jgi:hypothetical protein
LNDRYYVEQRHPIGKCVADLSRTRLLPKKSRGQLRQPLIAFELGARENLLDEWTKALFAPVISCSTLSASGVAGASRLEKRFSRRFIVPGIFARREGIALPRIAPPSIFLHERARHLATLDGIDEMSQLSRRYHGNCR